jgi:hypothetical protein
MNIKYSDCYSREIFLLGQFSCFDFLKSELQQIINNFVVYEEEEQRKSNTRKLP